MPVRSLPVPERFGSRFTVRFLSHTEIENPHGLVLKTDSGRLGDPIGWVLDKYFNLAKNGFTIGHRSHDESAQVAYTIIIQTL